MQLNHLRYLQSALWVICGCFLSNMNDILMKILGNEVGVIQTIFFRFFFNVIFILPLMLYRGRKSFVTKNVFRHIQRICFGVIAIGLACYSASILPLVDITILSFSQPIIFLPLAAVFLKESINLPRIFATLFGFLGVVLIVAPHEVNLNCIVIYPILSSICFSFLDIVTKKMIKNENPLTLIFYFSFGCTLLLLPFFISSEFVICFKNLLLLSILGFSSLMIQFCVYKSFYHVEISSLAPFRYTELIFSCIFGFILFKELPRTLSLIGAILIFVSALYLTLKETNALNSLKTIFLKYAIRLNLVKIKNT